MMEYRVLARKYRPTRFEDLIGQETLVQTLSNAIRTGRIAHAFLLTGIRGIGKTTTARIIARALCCIGPDGQGGPTITPCGECPNCKQIADDRHVDVLEMDAASHTGVGDIREIIDTVRYLPSSARYKIYIIDEVHMLSTSAFNALLKTLEEPPPHVKFIFATTEVRKIPVTILSRCQRFDLKRIQTEELAAHLGRISAKEHVEIEPEALTLLSVAAEGSVRDALSLLDQAIARSIGHENPMITATAVRQMIGSADKTATFRLLNILMGGDAAGAMNELRAQYGAGADPLVIAQDLLETVHLVTRVKVSPQAASDISLSEHDRTAAQEMAAKLSMPSLTRLWQLLLKGLGEVRSAPSALSALEMLLVRAAYAAQLPTPAEVIRSGVDAAPKGPALSLVSPMSAPQATTPASRPGEPSASPMRGSEDPQRGDNINDEATPDVKKNSPSLTRFEDAVLLFESNREILKYTYLTERCHLVAFEPGCITLRLNEGVPRSFPADIAACLTEWTGEPWKVTTSDEPGQPTLSEQAATRRLQAMKDAESHPLVSSVLKEFPGARLVRVSELG